MMTPARRSGGVLASALLRSAKRFVPDAVSPYGRRLLGASTDRLAQALVHHHDGNVGKALALLLAQRRIGKRQQQRRERQRSEERAAAPAQEQQRDKHGSQHRA